MGELDGRVALVTGASRGIGAAIASSRSAGEKSGISSGQSGTNDGFGKVSR